MNVFTNTKKFKKIIIALLIILLFNFCFSHKVKAAVEWDDVKNTMLQGTAELFFSIIDGIMVTLNDIFMGDNIEDKIYLSPENIIKGRFVLMDANIFKDIANTDYLDTDPTKTGNTVSKSLETGKIALKNTIFGWYYALRNLAIVALLCILAYVAIRMILSSVSVDKAKYKMMFKDWLVALCLLFAMHYIMVGMLGLTDLITNAINSGGENTNMAQKERLIIDDILFDISYNIEDLTNKEVSEMLHDTWGHVFVYAAVLTFTVIFAVKYLIRAMTITFLILLAPITCITYPIDKISDGKSQAYDMWFKEFLYQSIIQPFHLILYLVLIGAASEIADTNILYAIICFAIMLPAEKFIKQMFGFKDKLGSPLGALASAAALTGMVQKAAKFIGGPGGKGGGSGKGSSDDDDGEPELPPKEKDDVNPYDDGTDDKGSSPTRDNSGDDSRLINNRDRNNPDGNDQDPNNGNDPNDEERPKEKDPEDYTDDEKALLEAMNDRDDPKIKNEEDWTGDEYALAQAMEDYRNSSENQDNEESEDEANEEDDQIDEKEPNEDDNIDDETDENVDDGIDNNTDENQEANTDNNNQTTPVSVQRKPRPVSKLAKARRGVRDQIARDVRKRYGTTSAKGLGKRALKSMPRILGKGLSAATKFTLGAGMAGLLGMLALATGNPKAILGAMGAGYAFGSAAGRRINGVRSNINGKVGRYVQAGYRASRKDDTVRKKAKSNYMQNQKERDYVAQKLRDQNGGVIPSHKEIDQEMEKRWEYREAGITDRSVIDGARDLARKKEENYMNDNYTDEQKQNYNEVEKNLSQDTDEGIRYRNAYEQLNNNDMTNEQFDEQFGEGAAEKAREHYAMEDATNRQQTLYERQAFYAARVANDYKASDLRDPKKREQLQESIARSVMAERAANGNACSWEHANSVANSIVVDAGRIRGVELPDNLKDNPEPKKPDNNPNPKPKPNPNPNPNPKPNPNPDPGKGNDPEPAETPKIKDENKYTSDERALQEESDKRARYQAYLKGKEARMRANGEQVIHGSDQDRRASRSQAEVSRKAAQEREEQYREESEKKTQANDRYQAYLKGKESRMRANGEQVVHGSAEGRRASRSQAEISKKAAQEREEQYRREADEGPIRNPQPKRGRRPSTNTQTTTPDEGPISTPPRRGRRPASQKPSTPPNDL